MTIFRFILLWLLVFLLVRAFALYGREKEIKRLRREYERQQEAQRAATTTKSHSKNRGVSKEIGEYVDYEEIKD